MVCGSVDGFLRLFHFITLISISHLGLWCFISGSRAQEALPKFKYGMVTETGSQHRYNEDRGKFIPDLLAEFPDLKQEDVCSVQPWLPASPHPTSTRALSRRSAPV